MLESWLEDLPAWAATLFTLDVLLQIAALVALPALAGLVQRFLDRRLSRVRERATAWPVTGQVPWLLDLLETVQALLRPLSLWVLGRLTILLFQSLGRPAQILGWAIPFAGLWLIYTLVATLIGLRMQPQRVTFWRDQILRPLILVLALLQALGLLDNILAVQLSISPGVLTDLRSLLAGLIVFYVALVLSRHARTLLRDVALPRDNIEPSLNQIISTLSSYLIVLTGFWLGLSVAGIDVTTLGFIAGGISVGVGFGLQELINNFISGFILLFERSLVPGDVISVEGSMGEVEEVKLRTSIVRTLENIQLIVPNGQLLNSVVTNYTQDRGRLETRVAIDVGVSYDADPHQVMVLLLQAADHPDVVQDPPPRVLFTEFGDSSINFQLLIWVLDPLQIPFASSDVRLKIWDLLQEHEIEIPFPQRDLHLRSAVPLPVTSVREPRDPG
jgi:small-conductance mechanosensitive channel